VRNQTNLVTAAVFGVVWRYCQMSDHVCRARLDTIADQAGVNRRTVIRHLATLKARGWIVDLTPRYRNAPHTYQVTARLTRSTAEPPAQPAAAARPTSPTATDRSAEVTVSPGGEPESHSGSDWPSSPAVTASPGGAPESHGEMTPGHSDSDSPPLPAVTEDHLNPTLQINLLIDERDEIEEEEGEEEVFPQWWQVLDMLEFEFGRSRYARWFPELLPVSFDGAALIVAAADVYQSEVLNARIAQSASRMLSGILNQPGMKVTFVGGEQSHQPAAGAVRDQVPGNSNS